MPLSHQLRRTAPPCKLIDPFSVSGMLQFFKPGTGFYKDVGVTLCSADGDAVQYWQDQSGNGFHVQQATGAKKPVYKLNVGRGTPIARFDGVQSVLDYAGDMGLSGTGVPCTVIVVCSSTTNTVDQYPWAAVNTGNSNVLHGMRLAAGGGCITTRRISAGTSVTASIGSSTYKIQPNGWNVLTMIFTGTTCTMRINGVTYVNAAAFSVDPIVINRIAMGAYDRSTPVQFLNGDMGGALAYNSALDVGTCLKLERYLAAPFGAAA